MTIVNRVVTELRRLEADPRHRGVKKLVGFDQWRARVGEYRILYEVDDDGGIVHIYSVVHRGSAYR